MRIWLVPSAFAPHSGGIESVSRSLAIELQRAGHEVTVFTHRHPPHLPETELVSGIPVYRLPWGVPRKTPRDAVRYVRDVRLATAKLAEHDRPDIVNVHGASTQLVPVTLFARRARTPVALTTHGEVVADAHQLFQRSRFMRLVLNRAAASATGLSAPSLWARETAAAVAPAFRQARVIPNGIRPASFRVGPLPEAANVAAYGRHEHQKGYDLLLAAWKKVAEQMPAARLRIGGSGSLTHSLRADAPASVEFLGELSPEAVRQLLSWARTVAVPSRLESFGMVALEALAAGRVVVHSGAGGLTEATGTHAIVADPHDASAFADAILASFLKPASASSEWVASHDWSRVAAMYEDLYHRAVQAYRPPNPAV